MNRGQRALSFLIFGVLVFLMLIGFRTASVAFADGTEFGGPPCVIASSDPACSAFNREVIVDFGALQDKYNSIGPPDLLVPKDDDIFSDAGYGQPAPVVAGRFVRMSPSWISMAYGPLSPWGSGPGPSPVTDKEYHYRPSGYFCDDAGCHVVLQRYQEVWTLDDKSKETHQIQESNITGLQPMSSLTVFTRDAVADFGMLGNNFAVVENKYGGCVDTKYTLSLNSSFSLPLDGYQNSFIMDKSYFDASGGINGLFSKEAVDTGHLQSCAFVDMQPEDKDSFASHAVSLGDMLIPKDDDLFTADTNGYSQALVDNFKGFSHVVTYLWQASVPNAPAHISYHYEPTGYFCSSDGVFCKLILQRYKEVSTYADGSTKENVLATPNIAGLQPISSVGTFNRNMVVDLGGLNDKFVVIKESFESSTCAIATYSLAPRNQIEIPLNGQDYLVVPKDYFDKSGGIDGLFQKETKTFKAGQFPAWDYTEYSRCSVGDHTDMQPKNKNELTAHEAFTLSAWLDVPQGDDIFSIDANGYPQGGKDGFVNTWGENVVKTGRAPTPPSVQNKTYYYHPLGYYAQSGFGNILVVQRYKEIWTLTDGTTQEHAVQAADITGLQPIAAFTSQTGNPVATSTVQPITAPVSSTTQAPPLMTQSSSPSSTPPTAPAIPQQPQSHSFWERVWCFFKSIFGGSCN